MEELTAPDAEIQPHSGPPPYELLLEADPDRAVIDAYISDCTLYGITREKCIVAVMALLPHGRNRGESNDTLEIKNIAVAENLRGQGLGRALIQHAETHARLHGFRTLRVCTGNSSFDQLRLYQKFGYRIKAVDADFFTRLYRAPIFENGLQCRDLIILEKPVPPAN